MGKTLTADVFFLHTANQLQILETLQLFILCG